MSDCVLNETNIIINYNTANLCSSVPYESCVNFHCYIIDYLLDILMLVI